MSKRSKACEFPKKVRERIMERDGGCIFCKMRYCLDPDPVPSPKRYQIMHYVSRAHGGLGIEQNGAVGCQWHHEMMDNGNKGRREEMLSLMKDYLKLNYAYWEEENLKYNKWR